MSDHMRMPFSSDTRISNIIIEMSARFEHQIKLLCLLFQFSEQERRRTIEEGGEARMTSARKSSHFQQTISFLKIVSSVAVSSGTAMCLCTCICRRTWIARPARLADMRIFCLPKDGIPNT